MQERAVRILLIDIRAGYENSLPTRNLQLSLRVGG
jgi:hypothetical protein